MEKLKKDREGDSAFITVPLLVGHMIGECGVSSFDFDI